MKLLKTQRVMSAPTCLFCCLSSGWQGLVSTLADLYPHPAWSLPACRVRHRSYKHRHGVANVRCEVLGVRAGRPGPARCCAPSGPADAQVSSRDGQSFVWARHAM